MIIMTGNIRTQKKWIKTEMDWSIFVTRCRSPIKTSETIEQYKTLTSDKKTEIKDVGGYIGGLIPGDGQRNKNGILGRSLLVYDLERITDKDKLMQMIKALPYTYLLHSTHSHSDDDPHYRLIIPLKEIILSDMYCALSRAFAQKYLMREWIDKGSFEPNRLMFWPSCSCDAQYECTECNGQMCDGEEFCNEYYAGEWRNIRKWPWVEIIRDDEYECKPIVEDPTQKRGIVGAFCRAYDIYEAIDKFLPHIYKYKAKNRYKYILSESEAGLVIYNNWAYSNHTSDPAYGMLCNAFDLVRVHKFGADEDSFGRMVSWINGLSDQKICEDNLGKLEPFDCMEWTKDLATSKDGRTLLTAQNLELILANDSHFSGLGYEEFHGHINWYTSELTTDIYANIYAHFYSVYNIWSTSKLDTYIYIQAHKNQYNEVKDYLEALTWDNINRIDTVLIDYLGAEDNNYTRYVTRMMLGAAIHRIYDPGCKFDYMCILTGPQGIGKSTLLSALGGSWFCDSLTCGDMEYKTAPEKLKGSWIIEIPELIGLKRAQIERVKSFLSTRFDIYRAAYAKTAEAHLRQCVFFGTTNDKEFLQDATGNRRFLVVPVHQMQRRITRTDVDQIWAEALIKYKDIPLYITDDEVNTTTQYMQSMVSIDTCDPRVGMVEAYLNSLLPDNWYSMSMSDRQGYFTVGQIDQGGQKREYVSKQEIFVECFGKNLSYMTRQDSFDISRIMTQMSSWVKDDRKKWEKEYGQQWIYKRLDTNSLDKDFG